MHYIIFIENNVLCSIFFLSFMKKEREEGLLTMRPGVDNQPLKNWVSYWGRGGKEEERRTLRFCAPIHFSYWSVILLHVI